MEPKDIDLFCRFFAGNTRHYGVFSQQKSAEGEKVKGNARTVHEEVQKTIYEKHLTGEKSIGIIPIKEDNSVSFCAIDIDSYPVNISSYTGFIARYGAPFVPVRSKSGGLHLFVFFTRPVAAKLAQEFLTQAAAVLGLPKKTEIFPKQAKLLSDGTGTWINLPYFNAEKTERYAYNYKNEALSFAGFLALAQSKATTISLAQAWLQVLPLAAAPPCLQALYIKFRSGELDNNRNIFLFNVSVYLKSKFAETAWVEKLEKVNASLANPLPQKELDTTVVKSHERHTYSYKCAEGLLQEYCNKEMCATREYGKGSVNVSNFSFEKLVQVTTSPPYYKWTVNGIEMLFFSEDELRKQDVFLNYCIRFLHKLPNKQTEKAWTTVLNTALSHIEIQRVEQEEDISSDFLFAVYFVEFLSRPSAKSISGVPLGQVYKDPKEKAYFFRVEALIEFLEKGKSYPLKSKTKLHAKLSSLSAISVKIYDKDLKKQVRCWRVPVAAVAPIESRVDAAREEIKQQIECDTDIQERKEQVGGDAGVPGNENLIADFDVPLLDFSSDEDKTLF